MPDGATIRYVFNRINQYNPKFTIIDAQNVASEFLEDRVPDLAGKYGISPCAIGRLFPEFQHYFDRLKASEKK